MKAKHTGRNLKLRTANVIQKVLADPNELIKEEYNQLLAQQRMLSPSPFSNHLEAIIENSE
tara:strand:+ start:29 stop:211 length:183 start_codon:yes stop_codon:yes gene_type:complete